MKLKKISPLRLPIGVKRGANVSDTAGRQGRKESTRNNRTETGRSGLKKTTRVKGSAGKRG